MDWYLILNRTFCRLWLIGWSWRLQWTWWVLWSVWSSCCTWCVCVYRSGWWIRRDSVKASLLSVTLLKAYPAALHFQPGWVSVSCIISFYSVEQTFLILALPHHYTLYLRVRMKNKCKNVLHYFSWLGSYSLTWMFLASSSVLSLLTLIAIRSAISNGKRAIVALLLNIFSGKKHYTLCFLFCNFTDSYNSQKGVHVALLNFSHT